MSNYPVSVHLVTYNGAPWLPWSLLSLANQTWQDFFLLIIDNNSIDNSYDICQQFLAAKPELAKRARLVKNKQNIGFARGHNQALAWTESDLVLLLNQDVYLLPQYLEILVARLTNQERTAAVTGKLLNWQFEPATFHPSEFAGRQQARIDSLGLKIKRSRRVVNLAQGEIDHGQAALPKRIFGVAGTAPLYRRQALLEVAPNGEVFDKDFVSYKEDVDIAWRLQLAGYEAWVVPEAVGYHDRSLVAGKGLKGEYQQRHQRGRELKIYSWVNHLAVLIKNDGWVNFWQDFPWFLSQEMAKAAFLLFTDPLTLFRAKIRLLRLLPKFFKKRRLLKSTHRLSYRQLRSWWVRTKVGGQKI